MDHASEKHLRSRFTTDDLAKLKSVVRGKASATLGSVDVDDITGEILLSASVTGANAGTTASVAALAFSYARMPSYYATARKTAATIAEKDPESYERSGQIAAAPVRSLEVRDVLHSLNPVSGEVIWRCNVEGLTLAETATATGVSTATVHGRLRVAHNEFRAAWAA